MAKGDVAYFRAYLMRYAGSPQTGVIAGVGTTNVQARYDWWEYDDATVFEPRGPSDAPAPVMSTDLMWSVWLKKAGHYDITMGMLLNDEVMGYKQEWNDSDAPFGFAETEMGGGERHPDGGLNPIYNGIGWLMSSFSVIYPIPEYQGDPPNVFWPNFGLGAHVNGYVTVGTLNSTKSSDNELEAAKLEIKWTDLGLETLVAVPPSSQPGYADADAEGISFAFDSDTHATPVWTRVDA